jgi:hypothetical protein
MYKPQPDAYADMSASPWGGLKYGAQPGSMAPPPEAPTPMQQPVAPVMEQPYPTFPNPDGIGSQKGYSPQIQPQPQPQPLQGAGAAAPLQPVAGAAVAPVNPWALLAQGR